ncbi:VapE domain-containing protein [Pseudomonas baetica]|uniref:VapE domain-containing protein n=1 Tax=Pseudomonas baetica TaxID=674054 RepID=UPI003EE9F972
MNAPHVDAFLSRLQRVSLKGNGQWTACCPAHPDRSPSLSIKETDAGDLLVHCFGGCETSEVMSAAGMTTRDLFASAMTADKRMEYRREKLEREYQHERIVQEIGLAAAENGLITEADAKRLEQAKLRVAEINRELSDIHSQPPVALMSWPHTSSNGQPLNTIPNLAHMLNHYGFVVRYDVIRKDLRTTYPGQCGTPDNQRSKAVDTVLSLAALNRLPKSDTQSFLLSIGDDNAVNPVMDFITAKPWDGRSRFMELLETIKTRPGYDRELLALLLRRWLVSAMAAAAKPTGFWSKGVLVFQGEQSLGKTAWIRSLLPEELRDLVKIDATINPDNKDSIISAVSHWLVELGELDGTLRKADIARLKGFISQDVDQFRRPYGRVEEKFQRRTVFFASVNPEQFLADDTGNVRWWTVPVIGVNYSHGIDTQQLWAEVFGWFQAGERWWLDRNEEARLEAVNAEHQQTDPVQELIQSRYGAAPADAITRRMTATDVLLEMGFDRPTQRQKNDAGQTLRTLFGVPKRTKAGLFFDVPVCSTSRPY